MPDLFLPVGRGSYHGLFIELKYGKNKPTEKQTEWLKSLMNKATLSLYVMVARGKRKNIKVFEIR